MDGLFRQMVMSMGVRVGTGFAPGSFTRGVEEPPRFTDAADALLDKTTLPKRDAGEGN